MKLRVAASALVLLCTACKPAATPEPTAPPPVSEPAPAECKANADCEQGEICSNGNCTASSAGANPIAPGAPGASAPTLPPQDNVPQPVPSQAGPPAMASVGDLVPGVPTCKAGDGRTPIPVWKPSVTPDNVVGSAPPQEDHQVVVLDLESLHEPKCNDKDSNLFTVASSGAPEEALRIGVRGNTQEIDGVCHLTGLYRTELMPAKQGKRGKTEPARIEFTAEDASGIASSNRYCVQAAP